MADWPKFEALVRSMLARVELDADLNTVTGVGRSQRDAANTNDLSISSTVCTRQ